MSFFLAVQPAHLGRYFIVIDQQITSIILHTNSRFAAFNRLKTCFWAETKVIYQQSDGVCISEICSPSDHALVIISNTFVTHTIHTAHVWMFRAKC